MKDLQLVPEHNQVKPLTRLNLVPGVTSERGQGLLEVLVAMAIAIIIIAGLVAAVIVAVRNAQFARNQSLATKYASEGMEKIRSYRDQNDWGVFKSGCGSYSLGLVPSPFTRPPVSCQEIDPSKMKVTVTVSWTDSSGTHKSELIGQFTNWQSK